MCAPLTYVNAEGKEARVWVRRVVKRPLEWVVVELVMDVREKLNAGWNDWNEWVDVDLWVKCVENACGLTLTSCCGAWLRVSAHCRALQQSLMGGNICSSAPSDSVATLALLPRNTPLGVAAKPQ